jgi:hypothetical protein
MDYMCLLFCVFWLPSMMIALGLIYIFKKDWAWWFVERMLRNVKPQRTASWNNSATLVGVMLLVSGLAIIFFLFFQLSN